MPVYRMKFQQTNTREVDIIANSVEEAEQECRRMVMSGDACIDEETGELLLVSAEEVSEEDIEDEHDQFRDDVEADADALASAGMGTDEDYGYFGGDE